MSSENPKVDPDFQTIEEVLSGRRESFEKIVRKYQERVLRLCYSVVGESEAEDAAQEVFLKTYESLAQFKGKSSFSTWIYRVAANHCLNILSKRKRERTESLDALAERAGGDIPSLADNRSPLYILEKRQMVLGILERLSAEERMILALRELEGLNYRELAETLDISLDLVKVRLFRARKSFLGFSKKFL
jgi:RNA polymerase sigma-70 factor (ECF subfamily)